MVRPCINGTGRKSKKYKAISVDYAHKRDVLDYLDTGESVSKAIAHFYGVLPRDQRRLKQQQTSKWKRNAATIREACEDGLGQHRNLRRRGDGTTLSKDAEEQIVLWVNSFRKDGAPVSRTMLHIKAKEVAEECGIMSDKFAASDTWIQLFLRRHRLSLRARTRQGQTTSEDAQQAADAFQALIRQTIVEKNCVQVFNADQTAVFFEYEPKRTITTQGAKTVWVKCANKDKEKATAMLVGDWSGAKFPPFILYKSTLAKSATKQSENNNLRNGFGTRVWREIRALQSQHPCQIYGNKSAWWNADLSLKWLAFHFANRENRDDNVLLLWDDFSGHWTQDVIDYAASLNVVLLKVPPRYTYVCQPADISWNKPFKGGLRALWLAHLQEQLAAYRRGERDRQLRQQSFDAAVARARMEQDQEEANDTVTALQKQHVTERFAVTAPSRTDITEWISSCWGELAATTIVSGFANAGLLNDTRVVHSDESVPIDTDTIITELQRLHLTEEEVGSNDDIGGDSDDKE